MVEEEMEDLITIDWKKYIATLFRQWQLIIGITIIGILAMGIYLLFSPPPMYEASVIIASTKTLVSIDLGSALKSFTPEQLAFTNSSMTTLLYDRTARQLSYIEMVPDPAIAQTVLDAIGNQLPLEERNIPSLLRNVQGTLIKNTDSVQIKVKNKNPQLAADIANRWGNAYIAKINAMYGGTLYTTDAIVTESAKSKDDYNKARADLVDFTRTSKLEENKRRIEEIQTVLKEYYAIRANMQVVSAKQDQEPRQAILVEQTKNDTTQLSQAYTDLRQAQLFNNAVNDLRDQVRKGGPSAAATNGLALTLLKTQIYAAFTGSNTLQVQNLPESMGTALSAVTSESMLTDLDSLVSVLKNRESELQNTIDSVTKKIEASSPLPFVYDPTTLDNRYKNLASIGSTTGQNELAPLNQVISGLEVELRDLESQVALDNGKLQELTRTSDLAWSSYSNLAAKQAELALTKTSGVEVALGSSASAPDQPISISMNKMLNLAIAAVIGLVIGILSAFGIEIWQDYKGMQPKPVLQVLQKK